MEYSGLPRKTNGKFKRKPSAGIKRIQGRCAILIVLFSFYLVAPNASAQDTLKAAQSNRIKHTAFIVAGGYTALSASLYFLWYKNQITPNFKFFNDGREWKKVDKVGHAYGTYHLSRMGYYALKWAGLPEKKSAIYGGLSSLALMLPIEVMDGYSRKYGASWPDVVANLSGIVLFTSQQLLWQDQRIKFKFSYHPTILASQRPNLLGSSGPERVLKDYNGQTYWLSSSPAAYGFNQWPLWLNISVGYGAYNMVTGSPKVGDGRYSQWYFSPDINWKGIWIPRTHGGKIIQYILQGLKFPAPTLSFAQNKLYVHAIYY